MFLKVKVFLYEGCNLLQELEQDHVGKANAIRNCAGYVCLSLSLSFSLAVKCEPL